MLLSFAPSAGLVPSSYPEACKFTLRMRKVIQRGSGGPVWVAELRMSAEIDGRLELLDGVVITYSCHRHCRKKKMQRFA